MDPERFRGTVYRAAGWLAVSPAASGSAWWLQRRLDAEAGVRAPLVADARRRLSAPALEVALWHKGAPKTMLGAAVLVCVFLRHRRPAHAKGRRHSLPSVLALASAATLCGMRGWKAISEWVDDLGEKALARFGVRRRDGVRVAPSLSTIRNVRVDPAQLDEALRKWHAVHGGGDEALAIDGKTLRGALDEDGVQAHIMSVVGHETKARSPKKSRPEAGGG